MSKCSRLLLLVSGCFCMLLLVAAYNCLFLLVAACCCLLLLVAACCCLLLLVAACCCLSLLVAACCCLLQLVADFTGFELLKICLLYSGRLGQCLAAFFPLAICLESIHLTKAVLGQKPPGHIPPTKPLRTKASQSKIFVFHFLKIFMVSQVHNLLIVQWLPV